jgi:hypothetical protein
MEKLNVFRPVSVEVRGGCFGQSWVVVRSLRRLLESI